MILYTEHLSTRTQTRERTLYDIRLRLTWRVSLQVQTCNILIGEWGSRWISTPGNYTTTPSLHTYRLDQSGKLIVDTLHDLRKLYFMELLAMVLEDLVFTRIASKCYVLPSYST